MKIRLSGIVRESIVDGPGIRLAVFTQGCPHQCPGCHNPETHDIAGGYETDTDNILAVVQKNPLLKGVTFSGGEPFLQSVPLACLARQIHALGLDIITYTGYTFEKITQMENVDAMELLRQTDILIDGRFELMNRSLELPFRGSHNQRILDVRRSLEAGCAIAAEI